MQTTQHTHQVVFGRKVDGCPRCNEIKLGAPTKSWGSYSSKVKANIQRMDRGHVCSSRCGPVCTANDY